MQESLFEKQEHEEQLQLQLLQQQEPQQLEGAMDEVPLENTMPIVEEVDYMIIDLPAVEAIMPLPEATLISGTRRPCYGWIVEYESESDNEEQPSIEQHQMHVPSQERLLCKRKI